MKNLALLFSFLILIIFGYGLIINFVSFSFSWQNLIIYSVGAFIIYSIVRLVGGSLDKKFNKSVNGFLTDKNEELFNNKGLLRTFGILLVTLLPFLLYLFALALFSAIDFAKYGLEFLIVYLRLQLKSAVIGFAIVVIGTGIAILIGVYYLLFPPKRKPLGISLNTNEEKKLWKITREVASEIQAKPIDKIIITPDPGIGVYLEGNLFSTIFGGGKRVLEIGLSSLHNLTVEEFKAILAHEYGHFSNKDTQWTPFTYAMGNSLISALRATPGPSQNENEGFSIVRGIMSINPAYWLLRFYVNLYFKITNGFSRIREVMADIRAMKAYGGKTFRNALFKVATNDIIFSEVIQSKYVPRLLKKGKTVPNFSVAMHFVYESDYDKTTIEELKSNLLSHHETHNTYDSHPALNIRIDYSKKFDDKDEKEKDLVNKLFDNWDKINEKLAELYNLRLNYYLQA